MPNYPIIATLQTESDGPIKVEFDANDDTLALRLRRRDEDAYEGTWIEKDSVLALRDALNKEFGGQPAEGARTTPADMIAALDRLTEAVQSLTQPALPTFNLGKLVEAMFAAKPDVATAYGAKPEDEVKSYHGFAVGTKVRHVNASNPRAKYVVVERDPNCPYGQGGSVPIKPLDPDEFASLDATHDGMHPDYLVAVEDEATPAPVALGDLSEEDVVTFLYQGEHDTFPRQRKVEVSEVDDDALVAYDLEDDDQIKRFREDRIKSPILRGE